MKMGQTECSEMSAYKIQMPGNYPEESIQHSEHGKSLKSRKFIMSNLPHCIGYKEKYIEYTVYTKFLSLHIDNHLKWKNHIGQVIPTLSGACYALRSTFHFSKIMPFKST
jgi:hypothetical protein